MVKNKTFLKMKEQILMTPFSAHQKVMAPFQLIKTVMDYPYILPVPSGTNNEQSPILNSQSTCTRSTPLNTSAFGVTLDSSVKSRPALQTKSTSPGRLQFGVIICYDKIKRQVTGQCSAYHKMVVLDLV